MVSEKEAVLVPTIIINCVTRAKEASSANNSFKEFSHSGLYISINRSRIL